MFRSLGHLQLSLMNVLLPPYGDYSQMDHLICGVCWRGCKECGTRCVLRGAWAAAGRFHMTSLASNGLCVWNTVRALSHLAFFSHPFFNQVLETLQKNYSLFAVFFKIILNILSIKRSNVQEFTLLSNNANHMLRSPVSDIAAVWQGRIK